MRVLAAIALFATSGLSAQQAFVEADTLVIRIGEPIELTVGVRAVTKGSTVSWPQLHDTLSAHLEVLEFGTSDTLARTSPDGLIDLGMRTRITAFDTGFWAIPPFTFLVDDRPLETEALLVEVRGVAVDASGRLRDVSANYIPPFDLAFWLREHWLWFAGGAMALLLITALLWFLLRRPTNAVAGPIAAPQLPAHVRCLQELDNIEAEKLWQRGDHKAHHSRITDAVRAYLEERYTVRAMESTTDELLRDLRLSPLTGEQQNQVANLLRFADLVKFAKAVPGPSENEQALVAARNIVNSTLSNTTTHG